MTREPLRSLTTSSDGRWAAAREDRRVAIVDLRGGPEREVYTEPIDLPSDDVDLVFVGPPVSLAVVSRDERVGAVAVYAPPFRTPSAQLELEIPARVAASTGQRFILLSPNALHAMVLRSAGRSLASLVLDVVGPIELVVGLPRDQLLFALPRKLEIWDAVRGCPLSQAQFALPAPPRKVGPAFGHIWAMRTGSDEIAVVRLSDGRVFRHVVSAPVLDIVSHPGSPVLIIVTAGGLWRLHCHAHSLTPIPSTPEPRGALALHVDGEEIALVGFTGFGAPPWRVRVTRP